jgi:hypothetical protein
MVKYFIFIIDIMVVDLGGFGGFEIDKWMKHAFSRFLIVFIPFFNHLSCNHDIPKRYVKQVSLHLKSLIILEAIV